MAVVRATPRGVRVLAVAGDQGLLAGNVMDFAILQSTVEAIAEQGLPFANVDDPLVWGAFQYAAETAKLAAGAAVGAEFEVPPEIAPGPTAPLRARVVGDVLRSYVQGHVERAWVGIDALLDEAGVRATDLTHVLVEGGSMHLPGVMGALRARFEAVPVHLLSPEAVAAGAAILLADPNAALAERIASAPTGAGRTFMPEIAGVPGLVELLVRAGAAQAPPGRRGGDDARSAGPGGAGEEPGLERLTLAELRQRAEQGDLHGALRDLARLQQALEAELARLTTQVAPGTGVD
jgi:molecular chaperone DnaK (HSP70)